MSRDPSRRTCAHRSRRAQQQFLQMLPGIEQQARYAFRHAPEDRREERVQDVVAHAWSMFVRLLESGRAELAYASPLARYGIAQLRAGRRVGSAQNVRDVGSPRCRARNGPHLRSLHPWDDRAGRWTEMVLEDRRCPPDQIAAVRIDFGDWLARLPRRTRRIAESLAAGERSSAVAETSGLTRGRIAQLRRELAESWRRFQGELSARLEETEPTPA